MALQCKERRPQSYNFGALLTAFLTILAILTILTILPWVKPAACYMHNHGFTDARPTMIQFRLTKTETKINTLNRDVQCRVLLTQKHTFRRAFAKPDPRLEELQSLVSLEWKQICQWLKFQLDA